MSTYYFSVPEICRALSIREFSNLCSLIDEFGPKENMMFRHGSGSDVQTCSGRLANKKFRILRIIRKNAKVYILVEHLARVFGKVNRKLYEVNG